MTELRTRAYTVIRVVLGSLLLAAAALKIYGWNVSAVPLVGWFSTTSVQTVAVGWEILLSLWLLSGVALIGSWLAAIVTFVLLACISGYLGWIGQATCDCFGTIQASPWIAFSVDLTALLMFLSVSPSIPDESMAEPEKGRRETGVILCFVLGMG